MEDQGTERKVILTPVTDGLLDVLAQRMGLSKAAVLELAIRRLISAPDTPMTEHEREELLIRHQQHASELVGENAVTGERVYYVPTDRDPTERR